MYDLNKLQSKNSKVFEQVFPDIKASVIAPKLSRSTSNEK
jgi:hypothetical protein